MLVRGPFRSVLAAGPGRRPRVVAKVAQPKGSEQEPSWLPGLLSAVQAIQQDMASVKASQQEMKASVGRLAHEFGIKNERLLGTEIEWMEGNSYAQPAILDSLLALVQRLPSTVFQPLQVGFETQALAVARELVDAGVPKDLLKYLGEAFDQELLIRGSAGMPCLLVAAAPRYYMPHAEIPKKERPSTVLRLPPRELEIDCQGRLAIWETGPYRALIDIGEIKSSLAIGEGIQQLGVRLKALSYLLDVCAGVSEEQVQQVGKLFSPRQVISVDDASAAKATAWKEWHFRLEIVRV